jgi:Flp pilus assembly protein TadD
VSSQRLGALVIAALCAVTAVYLFLGAKDASRVERANDLGRQGDYAAALREVETVRRAPADAAALLVRARALTALGQAAPAVRAWRAALRRIPNDWKLHVEYARALARLGGDRDSVQRAYTRARELNPRLPAFG